jgi:hypothetical protein
MFRLTFISLATIFSLAIMPGCSDKETDTDTDDTSVSDTDSDTDTGSDTDTDTETDTETDTDTDSDTDTDGCDTDYSMENCASLQGSCHAEVAADSTLCFDQCEADDWCSIECTNCAFGVYMDDCSACYALYWARQANLCDGFSETPCP